MDLYQYIGLIFAFFIFLSYVVVFKARDKKDIETTVENKSTEYNRDYTSTRKLETEYTQRIYDTVAWGMFFIVMVYAVMTAGLIWI